MLKGLMPGGPMGGARRSSVHLATTILGCADWTRAQEGRGDCDATVYLDLQAVAQTVEDGAHRSSMYRQGVCT